MDGYNRNQEDILTKKWKHFLLKRDLCNIPIFKVYVQKEMGYVNYPVNLTPKFPSVCLLQSENSMIQRLETDLTIVKNLTLKLGPIL